MEQPHRPNGLVAAVFDLSFSAFVTPRVIKVLMILGVLGIGLWALVAIVVAFTEGVGSGLLALVLVPIFAALAVLALRVYLELIVVIFRIAENTNELVRQGRGTPPVV